MAESVAEMIRQAVIFGVSDELVHQLGTGAWSDFVAAAHYEAETMVNEALELTINEVING